ncbi:MAG: 30S ribosomal protein S18 [Myxococcales bacterium]|nr:30S ribosomal protein S18 [Myxococcales bacterium]
MARFQTNDFDDRSIDGGAAEIANENMLQRRRGGRKKICKFCAEHTEFVDYKDSNTLRYFLTERGKVVPRRISGNCARHQRMLIAAIKRSRMLALLPFTTAT